ncbi:hypothetical protein [Roseibium sp. RKSG952]|uniref:hypothetical protein n=1 Tax=Roseibium sp. RKSG952 TaxID=2529384 RepID=UPI0012BB6F7F|nr:hypothetical protein [Roseibium sp. RKSG952]MTH96001.1 hypothetical protein [Roseibium sp. RKSG952]
MAGVDKRNVLDWSVFSLMAALALCGLCLMVLDVSELTSGAADRVVAMRLDVWAFWLVSGGAAACVFGGLFPDRQFTTLILSVFPAVIARTLGEVPTGNTAHMAYAWSAMILVGVSYFAAKRQFRESPSAISLERLMAAGLLVCGVVTIGILPPILTATSDRLVVDFVVGTLPYLRFEEVCGMPGVVCASEAATNGVSVLLETGSDARLFVTFDPIRTFFVLTDAPGVPEIRLEGFANYGFAMRSVPGIIFGMLFVASRLTTAWISVIHRTEMRKIRHR